MKVLYSIQHLLLLATKRKGMIPNVSIYPLAMLNRFKMVKSSESQNLI